MKKLLLIIVVSLFLFNGNSFAQDKKIVKPAALGNAKLDGYIDECFAIYDKTFVIEENLTESETAIVEVEAKEAPTKGDIITISAKLKESTNKLEALQTDATTLAEKYDEVMKGAKTLTPKTKSFKALKNMKTALNALNSSKKRIPELLKKAGGQKTRVETVKVLN